MKNGGTEKYESSVFYCPTDYTATYLDADTGSILCNNGNTT
jgi:hypothetical protein